MSPGPKSPGLQSPAPAGGGGSARLVRPLAALLVLVLATGSSLAAVLLHGHPWGLALAWVSGGAALWALPATWWGRPVFALGWLAVLVAALFPRPEGDFLIADNPSGYVLLASGVAFMVVVMIGVRSFQRGRPAAR